MIAPSDGWPHNTPWGSFTVDDERFSHVAIHDAVAEKITVINNITDCPLCRSTVNFKHGQFNITRFRVCIPCALRVSFDAD